MLRVRYLLPVAGLLLLGIVGLLGYRFVWPGINAISLPAVEDCKLNLEPCSSSLPMGGRLAFEIRPRPPLAGETLHLRADFQGVEPEAVGVRFKGINMNMGQLEYLVHDLARVDSADGSVSFEGQGGVFICSIGLMRWHALVIVQIGGSVYEQPFNFETTYNGN